MIDDVVFFGCNAAIAPTWLLMLFAPRWSWTQRLVRSLAAPIVVALVYTILVLSNLGATDGGFFTLDQVALLFEDRRVLLTGWVHYLCIDLAVGSFLFRDGQRIGLPHWVLAPCLLLTLMWGPMGVLAYLGARARRTRQALAIE